VPAERRRHAAPVRRAMIFAAAADLFHARGYRGTNIDDIGVAVGISGPAIYRHFPNKEAILIELIEDSVRRGLRDVRAALRAEETPREVLHRLVRQYVDFAIADRKLVELADRELHHVSPEKRERIVTGLRAMLRGWVVLLRRADPELSSERARCGYLAMTALIRSVARAERLEAGEMSELYTAMALGALGALE
jgi:AcrR family transcriptional regulator